MTITIVDWATHCEALYTLRRQVLVAECGLPVSTAQDDHDPQSYHALIQTASGTVIATGRLSTAGRIERLAVTRHWRRQGIGTALLQALLDEADRNGFEYVSTTASAASRSVLLRLGFGSAGVSGRADGQELKIALSDWRNRSSGQLERALNGCEDSLDAAIALLSHARKELVVYTSYVHSHFYGDSRLAGELRRILTTQPRFHCRLLLPPARDWRSGCPALSQLSERVSAISLRCPGDRSKHEHAEFQQAFLIADGSALIHHSDPLTCTGYYRRHGGPAAKRLLNFFNDHWEHATADSELRTLGI